ncbi:hypothetical protein INR49_012967, partial [Caranx melampygus]
MRSSFSSASAATLDHELLCILKDHSDKKKPEGCPQSLCDPPPYCIRPAGVLRYNRESDNHRMKLTTIPSLPKPLTEWTLKCEYCGEKARPSLDLTWLHEPETAPAFCCDQRQQLCEMLLKQRCLFERRCDLKPGASTSVTEDQPAMEEEKLLFQGREMEDHSKLVMGLPGGTETQPELRVHEDYSIQLPVTETFAPISNVFRFRLSCAPGKGGWIIYPCGITEKCLKNEEEDVQALGPFCDHRPIHFGICHHQDGAQILHKYYSNGTKFLTLFHDGCAQVFYPSGLLALVVVVTKDKGRVCIVYDDSNAPSQSIRGVFQSDGRATCYHSNGNIWLSLNRAGGQCLDEAGARVRRWSWSSLSITSTPLHPVFLSFNKAIGVRVLGREQVFVSFLAEGQQARFSVGSCCAQGESTTDGPPPGPPVLKEELFVLAARVKIHMVIQQLHQCMIMPSNPLLPKITQAPHLHVAAQRLLEANAWGLHTKEGKWVSADNNQPNHQQFEHRQEGSNMSEEINDNYLELCINLLLQICHLGYGIIDT